MPNSSLFRLLLLLLPLALLLAACPEVKPATAALVVVRADDDYVASQLSSIRAEVYPVDAKPGTEPRDTREFELARGRSGAGRVQLPFSFGIEKASAELFLLVVTGYRAGEYLPADMVGSRVAASLAISGSEPGDLRSIDSRSGRLSADRR